MMITSEGIAPRRSRRAAPARALAMLALAALGIAACEGDNLFSGDGASFQPRVLNIELPDIVRANETISVRVDAVAARRVAEVIVSARGAVNRDTVIEIDEDKQQVSAVVPLQIPAVLQDTLLIIEAQISDGAGVRSVTRQAIASAFGPPAVDDVSTAGAVRAGQPTSVRISAFGARPITQLVLQASGAFSKDTTILVTPSQTSVTQDVVVAIPANVVDTLVTFSATATDDAGFTSAPTATQVAFIIDPPTVQLAAPPSVQPGSMLNVEVEARAIRKVSRLRIELSGGLPSVDVPITPEQATVNRFISVPIPGNIMATEIQVIARAFDRAGVESATEPQLVSVPTGSPMILTIDAPASVVAGQFIDVRVNAAGTRPIKEILVRWRGIIADSLKTPETRALIDPPRAQVSSDFTLRVPCFSTAQTLMILVTATDEADQVSPVASDVVSIAGTTACQADTTSTTIRLGIDPDAISAGSRPISLGDERDPFLHSASSAARRGRRRQA